MVIKKLISIICNFFGFRGPKRIKVSSYYQAIEVAEERPSEGGLGLGESLDGEFCCVCLSRLKEREGADDTRVLPCLHKFHRVCIDRWFSVCRKTCPVCRVLVEDEENSRVKEALTEEMVVWFSSFHGAGF
ncbi:E3 ubiquitin-protein ligase RHA2A-like [Actinidia eriantha]|uniref:E3 ubiquitin-protein ligase RHA2A-like n=1 Tax=Actinidia eriantha TaxID=165200 RepID=UPI0025861B7D|nr:E3 ubiquitin-protein ligase RHA2A-like [Actinidia eriantha]